MKLAERRRHRRPLTTAATARLALAAAAAGALTSLPAPARAADDLPPAIMMTGRSRIPRGDGLWSAALGFRTTRLHSGAFDAFSSNDAFMQVSLSGLRAFGAGLGWSGAVGLLLETGVSGTVARGADTSLTLSRAAAILEARFVPVRPLRLFARLAPGALGGTATVDDRSTPVSLSGSFSGLSVDGSAGAALCLTPPTTPFGVWLMGEGGYGWAGTHALEVRPALPGPDRDKAGTTSLGRLGVDGAFLRFAVALVY